jgi:hypothetical protein
MDQDLVVMYGSRDEILKNPVFRRLRAVKEDRVIYVDIDDAFAGALGFASTLSVTWLLDETEERLTDAGRRRPGHEGRAARVGDSGGGAAEDRPDRSRCGRSQFRSPD